jgi:hypothetical protein
MIELIKQSAVPANVMRSAAKGALALPPAEMIEVLVYLTTAPLFGDEARMTLAGWDEAACRRVCSDPATPREVLEYFLQNRRPRLMPTLLDNPTIPDTALLEMAQEHSAESVQLVLATHRAKASEPVLQALAANPVLLPSQVQQVRALLEKIAAEKPAETAEEAEHDDVVRQYMAEHADEIAAEEGQEFKLVEDPEAPEPPPVETSPVESAPPAAAVSQVAVKAARKIEHEGERISPLQKIARLTVGERVQLAIRGNKEERFILIRDGAKVVSAAVLESPKVNDREVEAFASMKNVHESVLRGIAGKRKYMKVYSVVRALANNPRCPLDVQLTIVKNLLNMDLRSLSANKNISDTVRKVAHKLFLERTRK